MAKERLKSPRARLFIALDLPEDVRDEIVRWQHTELAATRGLRLLKPDSLHATLVFLGYQAEKDIDRLVEAAFADPLAERPVPLVASDVRAVPPRRPRLFAIGLEDETGELGLIQSEMAQRLEATKLYESEKRPFWAHVTVARFKSRSLKHRKRHTSAEPPALPERLRRPFLGVRLTLYRSFLRPEGARYEGLAHLDLKGAETGAPGASTEEA